ncbi:MAG: hypothetical protein WDM80_01780 [Limisphaerales bacterium]
MPKLSWEEVASSADGSHLVAAAWKNGPIYLSTNSGLTWAQTTAPNNYWSSVSSSADGSKIVATSADAGDNRIYTSTNVGVTWVKTIAPSNYWFSVDSSTDGTKLVATTRGFIYSSTNAGATWTQFTVSYNGNWTPGNSTAMSADGTKQAVIAGGGDAVYISTNTGNTWFISGLPSDNWSSIACSADGTKFILAGPSGMIYTSNDSGTTWMSNSAPKLQWQSVTCSADGNLLVAASASNTTGEIWKSQAVSQASLSLTLSLDRHLKISWIMPSTNFALQQSSDLILWADVTNAPVLNLTYLQNEVLLSSSNQGGFYRLKTP